MRRILLVGAAALSFAVGTPVYALATVSGGAVTFDNTGGNDSVVINFNGYANNVPGGDGSGPNGKSLVSGLTGKLTLTLASISGNTFSFDYSMLNNSSSPITASRISGIGFNVDPNVTGVGFVAGSIFDVAELGGNFASLAAETCFSGGPGNCPASGGQAGNSIPFGATGTGTLTLTFASAQTSITLDNFLDRYQSIEGGGAGDSTFTSAVGVGTPVRGGGLPPPVPEASTWAMMLIGFGAMGGAIRHRRGQSLRLKLA